MTAPDQAFYDFEFTYSNRGIHTFIMLNNANFCPSPQYLRNSFTTG